MNSQNPKFDALSPVLQIIVDTFIFQEELGKLMGLESRPEAVRDIVLPKDMASRVIRLRELYAEDIQCPTEKQLFRRWDNKTDYLVAAGNVQTAHLKQVDSKALAELRGLLDTLPYPGPDAREHNYPVRDPRDSQAVRGF